MATLGSQYTYNPFTRTYTDPLGQPVSYDPVASRKYNIIGMPAGVVQPTAQPVSQKPDEMVEVTTTRPESFGTVAVTQTVPESKAEEMVAQSQPSGQAVIGQAMTSAAYGGPSVLVTPREAIMQQQEMEKVERVRKSDIGYQTVFATKKIITGEALGAGLSVIGAERLFGKGAEEAADWRQKWVTEQRQELLSLGRGERGKVFTNVFIETAPVLATAGIGAGFQGISIGATGAKMMTGLGVGLTGVGTGIAVLEAPKLNIKGETSGFGSGILIAGAGLTLAAGGLKAMKATKTREEYGEVLAVRREEIVPKGTIKKGDGWISTTRTTKVFSMELEREIAPKNLFSEGRMIAKKGIIEMWELKGDYFQVSRAVSGKAISGKGVVDVLRIDKESLGKFTGVDVFTRESISVPISFEEQGGFKVQVAKGTGPTGTTGLKPLSEASFQTSRIAVTSKIEPRITTSLGPVIAPMGGLKSEGQGVLMQPVQIQLTKQKVKTKAKLTPVSIKSEMKSEKTSLSTKAVGTSLSFGSARLITPTVGSLTTELQTQGLQTPMTQATTTKLKTEPIKTSPSGGGGLALPSFSLGGVLKRRRGGKVGYKRKTRYAPSIAGVFGLGKGIKMPKFELGLRIRRPKR